jgi:hypothetical protein
MLLYPFPLDPEKPVEVAPLSFRRPLFLTAPLLPFGRGHWPLAKRWTRHDCLGSGCVTRVVS